MQLTVRPLAIDTFRENTLLLSRDCRALRPERLAGVRKVEIRAGGRTLLAAVVICDDPALVGPLEAGLTQPAFRRLGVAAGTPVHVAPAPPPAGAAALRAKIGGATLTDAQIGDVIHDLAEHRWSDMEISAFLVACASFMTPEETLALTRAMAGAGRRLSWNRALVADKHCIGGVPGNRTSLIVAPVAAAHGLLTPKTSSRAITSPAGTADTMEVLARVDLDEDEMRAVVESCGGCIVWGGRVNLSPVDDVLISVERPLSLDTPEQMVASILSKKLAAGSTHLVLDLPVGPGAKMRDPEAALRLRKLFEFVADRVGLRVEVVETDGSQPVGRGVGPALEARDVLAVLRGEAGAPADLAEKSVRLAGRLIELDPEVPGGAGAARARELIASGAALRKLEAIAEAQGPSPLAGGMTPGSRVCEIPAARDGTITSVDCLRIARIARLAGAPTDPGAGLDLLKRRGERVRQGEPLYRLHAEDPADFALACEAAGEDPGFVLA
jgi:thymidine phosphorylase